MDANDTSQGERIFFETVDLLPEAEVKRRIDEATQTFLVEDQKEVWRRRRASLIHKLGVLEYNLDYDLRTRGISG